MNRASTEPRVGQDELSAAGADLSIRKAGRPGILNKAAELVGEPAVPS